METKRSNGKSPFTSLWSSINLQKKDGLFSWKKIKETLSENKAFLLFLLRNNYGRMWEMISKFKQREREWREWCVSELIYRRKCVSVRWGLIHTNTIQHNTSCHGNFTRHYCHLPLANHLLAVFASLNITFQMQILTTTISTDYIRHLNLLIVLNLHAFFNQRKNKTFWIYPRNKDSFFFKKNSHTHISGDQIWDLSYWRVFIHNYSPLDVPKWT